MLVERANVDNVIQEEEYVINRSDSFVLLRELTACEVRELFTAFEKRFTTCMKKLMLMKYSSVQQHYGNLQLRSDKSGGRAEVPYGALTRNGGKLVNLVKGAVTRGLIRVGAVPSLTAGGKPTVRVRKGWGAASEILEKLSADEQGDLVGALIDRGDVDDYFLFDQASEAAWKTLRGRVARLNDGDVADFLDEIAAGFTRLLAAERRKPELRTKGKRFVYAPVWFGQFLACQGVWLFPMKIFNCVRDIYPWRLMPMVAWLSVPEHSSDIAEEVLGLSRHRKSSLVLNVFVTSALCSDVWQSRRFCVASLIELKYWTSDQASAHHRTAACNEFYFLLCRLFEVDLNTRPEKVIFGSSKRLSKAGNSFRWCFNPTDFNTRFVSKLIGRKVTSVPKHVREWARLLDQLLPVFQVQDMRGMTYNFTCWLAYLMTLNESDAPTSLRDVDPQRHGRLYADFISRRTSELKTAVAEKSLSALKRAWDHDAKSGGYVHAKPNPFGFPIEKTKGASPDPSGRESIPEKVWAILVRLNYQDDYGFARSQDIYWPRVKNPATGVYEDVFFGLEAKAVDVQLMFGFRLVDVRWLDSGEGDEFVLDLDTMEELTNPLPCAIKGRRQGIFQRVWIDGTSARYELGALRIRDKSQRPKFHAFMDDRIARMLRDLIDMQTLYNPLLRPIPFIDDKNRERHTNERLYPDGFPIFRMLHRYHFVAVSEDRVRGYWLAFCKWAQPFLDRELGYHFPLTINGRARFRLHDARVTTVTHYLDRGEDLNTVRMIVGHENDDTTLHYYAGKMDAVHHAAVAREAERRRLEKPAEEVIASVISDGYKPTHIEGHIGLEMGERLMREDRPGAFEEFAHGLCPGGKCSEGGPIVAGKPTPVWRPMACSRCRFRMTGPVYAHGVARKVNRLLWERDDSFSREQKINMQMEKQGYSDSVNRGFRSDIRGEIMLRDNLLKDIAAEIETHRGLLTLTKTLRSLHADEVSNLLVPVSSDFDLTMTSYSLLPTHAFVRLFGILKPIVMPKEAVQVPDGIRSEFRSIAGKMMRRVGLEKLLIGADDDQQGILAMAFAEATMKSLATNEIAALADGQLDEIAFPSLVTVVEEMHKSARLIGRN